MTTPIILLCGAAGSGKDTVAKYIQSYGGEVALIAQADPMKRFAGKVFGFTEDQLWGPSESRNAPDERYASMDAWDTARKRLDAVKYDFIKEVLPGLPNDRVYAAAEKLSEWFFATLTAHIDYQLDDNYKKIYPVKQVLTARYVLQTLGTEWGRDFNPSMWNALAINSAGHLLSGGYAYNRRAGLIHYEANKATPDKILAEQTVGADLVVITDGRFRNEVVGVKRAGGIIIKIENPVETELKAGVVGHRSETEQKQIPNHFFDFVVINDKKRGLLALENVVLNLVKRIQVQPQTLSTDFIYRRVW